MLNAFWCAVAPAGDFQSSFSLLPSLAHSDLSEEIVEFRLRSQLDSETRRLRAGDRSPVFAPSCLQSATFSDFFEIQDIHAMGVSGPRTAQTSDVRKQVALLSQSAKSLKDVLDVLRTTEIGTAILKKFFPKFGFEIKIASFNTQTAKRKQDPSLNKFGRPAALFDLAEKTIFIDEKREVGQVAFVLLHEIVHSLDGDFAKAYEKEKEMRRDYQVQLKRALQADGQRSGINQSDMQVGDIPSAELARLAQRRLEIEQFRDIRIFRAERFAYDASYRVWSELDFRFPGYYQTERRGLAGKPVQYDDDWLVKILQLDAPTIARYLDHRCRTGPAVTTEKAR